MSEQSELDRIRQELNDAMVQLGNSDGGGRAVNRFIARMAILLRELEEAVAPVSEGES